VFDLCLAARAASSGYYLFSRWLDITISGGITTSTDTSVGMRVIALVMITVVRRIGWFLAGIIIAFLAYPLISPWLPGVFTSRGYSVTRIAEFMTTSSEGIYAIPLGVSATLIIMFSVLGSFLNVFGAGDFFPDLQPPDQRHQGHIGEDRRHLFHAAGHVFRVRRRKRRRYRHHDDPDDETRKLSAAPGRRD
jgi:TRAP-type uncharacterized transport system fused permease subunit